MQATETQADSQTKQKANAISAYSLKKLCKEPVMLLAVFWLGALLFIGIQGEFPINDDWIYAESVKHFVENGRLRLLACAPACVFQILSAALFCKIFGFSYGLLRATGFAFAVLGSFALYGSCRLLQLPKLAAALFALCLAANPLYLSLAFSFMTDTPALALTLLYVFFLFQGLKKKSELSFFYASLALIAATLVRQNLGFIGLINFGVLCCFWLRKKHSWTMAFGLVLSPLAAGYLADKWMLATNDFNSLYIWYKDMVARQVSILLHRPSAIIPTLLKILGELFTYLGLFCLPLLACVLPDFLRFLRGKGSKISPAAPVLSAGLIVFSLTKFISENRWMPFSQNLLRLPELGAHTILGINHAALPAKWQATLTWLSGVSGFVLAAYLLDAIPKTIRLLFKSIKNKSTGRQSEAKFARASSAAAALMLLLMQLSFNTLQAVFSDIDRYYLFPLIGALLCLAVAWRRHRLGINFMAMPLLLLMSLYSLAGTQDMMSWNRARWQAVKKLEAQGINYKQIDGGAEYNYDRQPLLFKNLILHDSWYEFTQRGAPPRDQWRWWTINGEDYIISFSPVPDYEQISKEEYWSALSGKREILVLRKLAPSQK